jgi:hypothetical protein
LGLKPNWLAADTACGTAKFFNWTTGTDITPHISRAGYQQATRRLGEGAHGARALA